VTFRRTQGLLFALLILCYILFIFISEETNRELRATELRNHAKIVENSLWNMDPHAVSNYLAIAAQLDNYEQITIFSLPDNKQFLDIQNPATSRLSPLLLHLGLIRKVPLQTTITHRGEKIGRITAIKRDASSCLYLTILLIGSLLFFLASFFAKTMNSAAREARETARRLADNLNNLPTPALTVDRNFVITFINKAAADLIGRSQEQCVGRFCYDTINQAHCQTDNCRVKRAMNENRVAQGESCLDPAGKNIPIRYLGAPMHDGKGRIIGGMESLVDTSELQNALESVSRENRLREGEILLNKVMQGQQDLPELCDRILATLCTWMKLQLGALYIADHQEELTLTGSYALKKEIKHTTSFAKGEGIAGQAAKQQHTLLITQIPSDSICLAGSSFTAPPRAAVAVPLLYHGLVKGVLELGSFDEFQTHDIDFLERISANIALAIDSTQAREQIEDLLLQARQQTEELQAQQEELQSTNVELEEQTMALQQSEETLRSQQEELEVSNEELEEKSERLERQNAKVRKKNLELEEAWKDIEKKSTELLEANRYKSEFLANMSHELRTPLNSLLLLARNLSQNKDNNLSEGQLKSAEIIYNSGKDLLELINDILDLSKIEAGKMEATYNRVEAATLPEWVLQNFQHMAEEKQIALSVTLEPNFPATLVTDRHRLEQILRNLVGNAIKFTDKGGVSINFHLPEKTTVCNTPGLSPETALALTVTDTGIGIAPAKQPVIFDAFKQAEGGIDRRYGGSGLGLSISKELAQLLGGEIQLISAPNKGSSFTLLLPLNPAEEGKQNTTEASYTRPKQEKEDKKQWDTQETRQKFPSPEDDREVLQEMDKIILIVEDDANFAEILLKLGRKKGFKGIVTASGNQALKLAATYMPGAILLDIRLPDIDGWQVLDTLKKDPALRHIPVHMLSAEEKTIEALKKGAVDFLSKPISEEELRRVFKRLEEDFSQQMKNLLLVENDPTMIQDITRLIGNNDVKVHVARNGAEALEFTSKERADCIILDLGLPDMSGCEFLKHLEQEQQPDIPPVIVYTGRDLNRKESLDLEQYSASIIVKGVKSEERLLDETALFLHRVIKNMPEEKRKMIANLYDQDKILIEQKILIVDDDMRNAFALSKILGEKGMEISIAHDGLHALEILEEQEGFDLILMDIMMPKMDGLEAIKAIRAQDKFWNLPIIALTAKAMPEDKEQCMAAGANDYLAKPVEEGRLLSMMRVWLYR